MANSSHSAAAQIGLVLTRIAIPGWVSLGAIVKLVEMNPGTLPGRTIGSVVQTLPMDPVMTLAAIVGLEFVAVAIMLTLAPLARATAVTVLALFCAVLFGEMAQGAVTSGCLGSYSPTPMVMLVINGALLLAVLCFDPSQLIRASTYNLARAAAILLSVTGFTISFNAAGNTQRVGHETMAETHEGAAPESVALQLNLASPSGAQRATASPSRH